MRDAACDVNWGRRVAQSRLNPQTDTAVNKRRMRDLFAEHDVPTPELLYSGILGADNLDALYGDGRVMVGRPDFHTKGRGFWLCRNRVDIERALRGTRRKKPATHFMEYISPEEAPKEFRVHVFLGESIRISQKKHTDFHIYTTQRPDPELPKKHIRTAAKAAVAALGLDFGVVDIMTSEDQTQVWVLEVNTAPGLGGTTPRLWAETLIRWKENQCDESE